MPNYNVGNVEVGIATQAEASIKMLDRAAAKCNLVAKSLDTINKRIDKTSTASNNAAKSTEKLNKKFSQTLSLNRIYFLYNYTKRLASGIADIIQTSIDYQETLNKFQNSMGNMYGDAVKFQNKITEAYSLSSKSLLDYQANFNNMLKGLGQIDETVSYSLSEKLTEMGVDIASLYNTSIESAMTKLQAALAQQTRPIRSVAGFDITQNTLSNVMAQIGINDRQISQLSQIEKRLLIVIALQRQMANTNTFGDWARTMNQPANQLRILKEQLIELKTVLGSFFIGTLRNVLPYVNGIVMALKEVLKTIASLMGIDINLPDSMSFDIEFGEEAEDAAAGLDKATKSAEKLKKATTGIDELNIISQDSDTSGGGASGVGGIGAGVDDRLLKALDSYKSQLDKVDNKAQQIRDKIMTWLGFTKQVDDETGEVTWKLNDGYTNLEKIQTALEIIGSALLVGKVAQGISKLQTALGLTSFLAPLKSAFTDIGQSLLYVTQGAGTFSEVLNDIVLPALGTIAQYLGGFALIIGGVFFTAQGISKLLDDDVTNNLNGVLELLGGIALIVSGIAVLLGAWPVAIVAGIVAVAALVIRYWDVVKKFFTETLPKFFTETLPYYVGFAIGWIVAKGIELKNKIINAVGTFLSNTIKDLADKSISEILHSLWRKFINFIKNIGRNLKKMFRFFTKGLSAGAESVLGADYQPEGISGFASGGYPTRGDYFLANENGKPEYVGSIGNRTAVANQNQIVQGISYGVAMANSEQNALLRTQNDLLMRILSKGTDVYLNGRKVTDELSQVANARGTNPLSGGFSYV